jgi:hypothetical protein
MYKRLRWFVLLVGIAGVGHADELVMPDGAHWQVAGTSLYRSQPAPPLDATMNLYAIGIGCEAGLREAANVVAPAYLPAAFYPSAFEEPNDGDGDAFATVCADLPRGVLVANLQWKGALATADAASFRGLLEFMANALTEDPPAPATEVGLFEPPSASVPLDAKTGVWNFVRDRTTVDTTTLVQLWPMPAIVMQLQRAAAAQQCNTVGFDTKTPRPSWAPATFYAYGGHRDDAGFACLDGPGGKLVLVSVIDSNLDADDAQRVGAMLDAIATALGNTVPVVPKPAPAATIR